MISLGYQYTAYKEMLLELSFGNVMPVRGIEKLQEDKGYKVYFREPLTPSRASEAILFLPPGYLSSINENPLYPDDHPQDLLSSINGGTDFASISSSFVDGEYLILYKINEIWHKVEFTINENNLERVNNKEVIPQEGIIFFDEHDLYCEMDIDNRPTSLIDAELTVQVLEGSEMDCSIDVWAITEIDCDMTVSVTDGAELDSEIAVKYDHVHSIDSEILVIYERETSIESELLVTLDELLESEITVKYTMERFLDSEITVKIECEEYLDSEITVKQERESGLYTDIMVYVYRELDCEITVKIYEQDEINSEINVQRVDNSYLCTDIVVAVTDDGNLNSEIAIFQSESSDLESNVHIIGRTSSLLPSELTIGSNHTEEDLDTEIFVIIKDSSGIESMITIPTQVLLEVGVSRVRAKEESLLSEIYVVLEDFKLLDCELYVLDKDSRFESVTDLASTSLEELDSYMLVIFEKRFEIDSEIYVTSEKSRLESIVGIMEASLEELESNIEIMIKSEYDMESEIYISARGAILEATGKSSIHSHSEIESEVTVMYDSSNDLSSEIIILEDSRMEITSAFEMVETKEIDSEIVVIHTDRNEIYSDIVIIQSVKMEVAGGSKSGGASEIDSYIFAVYSGKSEMDCEMMVTASSIMQAALKSLNIIETDLDSEITIKIDEIKEIDSEITVEREDACPRMRVAALYLNAVLRNDVLKSIKDTTVYSPTPYTNYGELREMSVGKSPKGEEFKSLMEFDLRSLEMQRNTRYNLVSKAILRLNTSRLTNLGDTKVKIKVHITKPGWHEKFITWNGHFGLGKSEEVAEFTVSQDRGIVEVDVTKSFEKWHERENDKDISFMLEISGVTSRGISFTTKESGISPELEMWYYRTLEDGNYTDSMDSEIYALARGTSDVESEITVVQKNVQDDLLSEMEIATLEGNEYLDSEIEISQRLRVFDDLDSELEIERFDDEDEIEASIDITRYEETEDLDSEITIERKFFKSYAYIM